VTAATPTYSARYLRLVLGLMIAAVGVEFFHRQILAVSVEPLRRDLGLSDTQMGSLLTLFACAYGVVALALGRIADASDRRAIYAVCIGFWSAATAAGAAVAGYPALLATRIAAGAGQAGSGACCTPLLVDYVPPERRGTALGLLSMGATLGTFLALAVGGLVVAQLGWRWLFAASGAAGVVFAIAFGALVKEPPRGWSEGRAHEAGARPSLAEALRTLSGIRALRHLAAGSLLATMGVMAAAQWGPAFFERAYGFGSSQAGGAGAVAALFGTLGAVAGGIACDRLWARRPSGALLLPAVSSALAFPLSALAFTAESGGTSIALLCGAAFFSLIFGAPIGAIAQALAPLRMRAVASGLLNALLTFFGMGVGPLAAGWISDRVGSGRGLGTALACVSAVHVWAGFHLWRAARALELDLPAAALARRPASEPG